MAEEEVQTEEVQTEEVQVEETKVEETKVEETKTEEVQKEEVKTEEVKDEPYWKDDWRQKIAEHASAGNKKAYEREMRRLERLTDPAALYGQYREMENKFHDPDGGLIRRPGKDASEEDIKAFHKALGVPEKAEELVSGLELPDGVELGKQDKALASEFAESMHASGLNQAQMNTAMAWYFKNQEEQSAHIDELDDKNRISGEKALKEEFGGAFKRNMNAMNDLFSFAPGGVDMKNEDALINRLLAGRMADGTIIGDDPDMTRFLVAVAKEVNPVATVVDDPGGSGKGLQDEIKEIEGIMRTDRRAYNKDVDMQQRLKDLYDARAKLNSR